MKEKFRKLSVVIMSMLATMLVTVSAFAESGGGTGTGTASSAVTGAMQTVANDMVATGNAIIPIALTVVGIAMVVVFGVRIFKKVAK